jgi:hypothetical protein
MSKESGEDLVAGRYNRAEHWTRLLGQAKRAGANFMGGHVNAILNVEAVGSPDPEPGNPLHGIVARPNCSR